jgi:hypothetical protein
LRPLFRRLGPRHRAESGETERQDEEIPLHETGPSAT